MKFLVRAAWLTLIVALAFSFAPTVAWAQQGKVREELPEKLRTNWDAAGELFDDANFEAALLQYEAIYKESKNPRVLYNIGVCWKERKYYARAATAWEGQLAQKEKLPKAELDRATTAIETVKPFITTLEIESNQTGAKLSIKDLDVGVTPFKGSINIDVGPNKLVLEKTGFARSERTIEVLRGQPVKVKLNMVPAEKTAPAKIAISGAEDAEIFIDGTEMGPAPFTGEVPTGRHTFEARKKGFVTGRQTSDVKLGEPLRITLALTPELTEGKVRIRTGHPDAAIRIDGEMKGTGTWEGLLSAGGHNLEVSKSGYKTRTQELSVAADQERVLDISLEEDQSNAWIYWTVTGALVAAGAATTAYFVFKPSEAPQVQGTFAPGVVPTFFRF
jgi:hypothetical protein